MKKLLLFTMLLPMMVSAQETVEINGIYYKLSDANKTAVVTKNPHEYSGEIIIPQVVERYGRKYTVTKIDYGTFWLNRGVTSIHMPITIEEIGDKAFINIDLPSLEIPQNVVKIGKWALMYNENINIYCYAKTPPAIGKDVFHKSKNFMLYVPEESLDKYKKADQWKKAKKILPITSVSWAVQQQERYLAEQKRIAEEQERKRIEARQKAIKDSIEAKRKLMSDSLDAAQGNVDAQLRMAKRYENGDGVKKDFNKAFDLYRKAAEAGNADAQYNLGTCYYNGVGTEKDVETGMEWFNKAAAQGHGLAKTRQKAYQKEKRYHGSYWIKDDNWKINFQNGHYLMNDGTSRWYGQTKDFFIKCEGSGELRLYENNEFDRCIDENAISCTSRVTLIPKDMEKFNSLKSQGQSNVIKENLKYLNLKHDGGITIRISDAKLSDWDYNTIGYYENGKYKSNEYIAAEEDKAWKAAVAPYTKRFGFNPSEKSAKQLITYGRSFSLLKDWYYFLRDHDYTYYFFNIHEDRGSVKCYGIFYDKNLSNRGKKVGYIWVAGGKITSVKWL